MRIPLSALARGLGVLVLAALAPLGSDAALAQDSILPPRVCVRGFSKLIEGQLEGVRTSAACVGPLPACGPAQSDATLTWEFRSNPANCEAGAACDESRDLQGRIVGKLKVSLRAQRPCPYRGAYEGTVEINDGTGIVATGRLQATLGVGTHQKPCVGPANVQAPCETCCDVNFAFNTWRIGTEGTIDAPVTAGRYRGCRIRASIQSDYFVSTLSPPGAPWGSKGNIDGVMECPCPGSGPLTPAE